MRALYRRVESCGYCSASDTRYGTDGYIPVELNPPEVYALNPEIHDLMHDGIAEMGHFWDRCKPFVEGDPCQDAQLRAL